MAKPQEAAPVAAKPGDIIGPVSRFQAQRNLGLFAKWDMTMLALMVLTWVSVGYYWIFCPTPNFRVVIFALLATIVLAIGWLIVLMYRVLIFVLDMHADIALLPEAAARVVLGYYEGRVKKP